MSDVEEPPTKVTKIDLAPLAEAECMDKAEVSQEEWLSEELPTDDDYNPADQEGVSNIDNASQGNSTMVSGENSMENLDQPPEHHLGDNQDDNGLDDLNITSNLSNADNFSNDLSMFLVRKDDGSVTSKMERCSDGNSDIEESVKHSDDEDDDGHNTDELLRMLGEDENKDKEKAKNDIFRNIGVEQATAKVFPEDDDDDDVFEGAKITKVGVAKNAMIKKYSAKKAVPEKMSDSEMSPDEAETIQKVLKQHKKTVPKTPQAAVLRSRPITKTITKTTPKISSNTVNKFEEIKQKPPPTLPVKNYQNKSQPKKIVVKDSPTSKPEPETSPNEEEEIMDEQEYLDEELFEMEEEFEAMSRAQNQQQRIMRPEQMDEEIPTDEESDPSDTSFYDELPSSESEDIEDWFALDIRAERAGDYIPLLGNKAMDLLTQEKKRVHDKLSTIKESITALAIRSKEQMAEIEDARKSLAELDALLTYT